MVLQSVEETEVVDAVLLGVAVDAEAQGVGQRVGQK